MKEEDKTKSKAKKIAITRTFLALPCHSNLVQPDTKALDKLIVSKAALVCKTSRLEKVRELLEEEGWQFVVFYKNHSERQLHDFCAV